ncbi:hypothetical protein ANN_16044 [Periplaneta americana]|uniref:Uncharacterized protein n=1 Tax=Periplaneta americana TaxID=6978 RepID=A0ABQ8SIB7_PERAM|nr:hypothetical protein ANN_16044 [Periplaneta americana]
MTVIQCINNNVALQTGSRQSQNDLAVKAAVKRVIKERGEPYHYENRNSSYPSEREVTLEPRWQRKAHSFGRPEGKRPLRRPKRRWEDNIKMDLREVGYDDRDWINLAQDRDRWRFYVRAGSLKAICNSNAIKYHATDHMSSLISKTDICHLHSFDLEDWLQNIDAKHTSFEMEGSGGGGDGGVDGGDDDDDDDDDDDNDDDMRWL